MQHCHNTANLCCCINDKPVVKEFWWPDNSLWLSNSEKVFVWNLKSSFYILLIQVILLLTIFHSSILYFSLSWKVAGMHKEINLKTQTCWDLQVQTSRIKVIDVVVNNCSITFITTAHAGTHGLCIHFATVSFCSCSCDTTVLPQGWKRVWVCICRSVHENAGVHFCMAWGVSLYCTCLTSKHWWLARRELCGDVIKQPKAAWAFSAASLAP